MNLRDSWAGLVLGVTGVFVVSAGGLFAGGHVFYALVCSGIAAFLASDLAGLYFRAAGRGARRKAFVDSGLWREQSGFSSAAGDGSVQVSVPPEQYFRDAFYDVPVEAASGHASPGTLGFDLFSDANSWSEAVPVNPATGLPMTNGVDVAGNALGSDTMSAIEDPPSFSDDSFSHSDDFK